jgi:membrane protein YqaA with SNARE-associated domain
VDFSLLALASPVWTWLHRLGGPGLLIIGVIDGSALPLPGSIDVFLIILAANRREWWPYYAFMATVGAVLGGYLTYRLAEKGGKEMLEKKIGRKTAEKIYKRFEHRGLGTVAVAAVLPPPLPTFPILLTAGALQYPAKKFLTALTAGRAARYFALAFVAHLYGKAVIAALSPYYKPILYSLLALACLGAIAAVVYFAWYRPKKQREERKRGEKVKQFPIPFQHDEKEAKHDRQAK